MPGPFDDLRYGSLLGYAPRGESAAAKESRALCSAVKQDGVLSSPPEPAVDVLIARLAANAATRLALAPLLGPDVTLVPCPTSTPGDVGGETATSSAPQWICRALLRNGLGVELLLCLERTEPVRKSALSAPGERVSVERHLETMRIRDISTRPKRVTIVDDVVTRGTTLLAAASLLRRALPDADIAGFALLRTVPVGARIERVVDPVLGRIALTRWGDTRREP